MLILGITMNFVEYEKMMECLNEMIKYVYNNNS